MGRVWRGLGAAGPLSEVTELFLFASNVTCDFFLHGPRVGWVGLFVLCSLLFVLVWARFLGPFSAMCFLSVFLGSCVCLSFVYFTCIRRCLSVYLFCLMSIGGRFVKFCVFASVYLSTRGNTFLLICSPLTASVSCVCLSVRTFFIRGCLRRYLSVCLSVNPTLPLSPSGINR